MKIFAIILLMFLYHTNLNAKETFLEHPDSYRGALYGHLLAGSIVVEGVQLNRSEVKLISISHMYIPKDGQWYRYVQLAAELQCRVTSIKAPSHYVVEIKIALSLDGKKIQKIIPYSLTAEAPNVPEKTCEASRAAQNTPNKSLHRTHLSVTPFAEQKPCQPALAAELNRYVSGLM